MEEVVDNKLSFLLLFAPVDIFFFISGVVFYRYTSIIQIRIKYDSFCIILLF